MPGPFAGLAGALGDAQAIGRQQALQNEAIARQRKLDQEAEQQHQIQQAALIAALHDQGIVPTGQEQTQHVTLPDVGTIGNPGAPRTVDSGMPDATRYTALGNTGYAIDEQSRTRPLVKREREIQSRVAFLRATRPEYKTADPEELRALAADDATFREIVKPQPGHNPVFHDTQQGVVYGDETGIHKTPFTPVPRRGSNINLGGGQPTPKTRAEYVQRQLTYYMRPKTVRDEDGILTTEPGMAREDAIREANADADAVYGTHDGHAPTDPTPVTSRTGAGSVFRGAPPNADYSPPPGSAGSGRTAPSGGANLTLRESHPLLPSAGKEAPDAVLNQLIDQYGDDNAAILKALKRMGYSTGGGA